MALPTIGVLDKDDAPQTVNTLRSGSAVRADSAGVALSTEDIALLDGIETSLTTLLGHVDTLETLIASTNTKLDTAITALQIVDNQQVTLLAGTAAVGKVDHSTTGVGHGVKTVAAAGTDEALAGSTVAKWVTVQAQTDNTGLVAVGAAGVDATVATGTGVLLAAGESITLPVDNLADVFIDSTVSGDGVRYTYGT